MAGRLIEGRTALVTGGGTGIGFGCARKLLEHGAQVTIVGRNTSILEKAAHRLRLEIPGANIKWQRCDVTVEGDVANAVASAAEGSGHLDIAVANAGSGSPGHILQLTPEMWKYTCELNIMGTALTIKHAGLTMRKRGGSIITISSVGGQKVEKWMAVYSASKAAVEMLTRCAALELAPFKIRVNCIRPGYVITEATSTYFAEPLKQRCLAHTPLGRAGMPEEIGDGVVFLASDMSKWVTGQVFGIDGGMGIPVGEEFEELSRSVWGNEATDALFKNGS